MILNLQLLLKNSKKNQLLILFVLCTSVLVEAQIKSIPYVKNFGSLKTRNKSEMVVNDSGHIWLASGNKFSNSSIGSGIGLCKYDGNDWKVYNKSNSNYPADMSFSVVADSNKHIWTGTDNGLVRLELSTNKIEVFNTNNSKLLSNDIYSLSMKNNILWIAGINQLVKYDGNTFKVFDAKAEWGSNVVIYSIDIDNNGVIWGGSDKGFFKFENEKWTIYNRQNSKIESDTVYKVVCDSKNNIFLGTNETPNFGTICRFNNNEFYPIWNENKCNTYNLPPEKLIMMALDNEDNLFFPGKKSDNPSFGSSALNLYSNNGLKNFYFSNIYIGDNPLSIFSSFYYYSKKQNLLYLSSAWTPDSIYTFDVSKYKSPVEPPENTWGELSYNKTKIAMRNDGVIGLVNKNFESVSEMPQKECKTSLLAAGLWISGIDKDDSIRTACGTYGITNPTDFFPGSLDTTSGNFDINGNAEINLDKVWKIHRITIDGYKKAWDKGDVSNGNYGIPDEIKTWPGNGKGNSAKQLAPYFDNDNNGIYDPTKGDYPEIKGDEMLFWIMNDNNGIHQESFGSKPMGIELHCSAYTFGCDSISDTDSMAAINYTTYFNYKIYNRGNTDYKDFTVGVWVDGDLGFFGDDYVGCDTVGNYGFYYNGDNDDEGLQGYGENPPMFSTVLLSNKMSSFVTYNNDYSVYGNPQMSEHFYNYLHAKWKDNSNVTYGGNGYMSGGQQTNYMYPGKYFNQNDWNEMSAENTPSDRRMLVTFQPEFIAAKNYKEFDFAFVFSWERTNPNGKNTSWALNEQYIRQVKEQYKSNEYFKTCDKVYGANVQNIKKNISEIIAYPNPSKNEVTLSINSFSEENISINLIDVNGKLLQIIQNVKLTTGDNFVTLNTSEYASGFYFVKIENDNKSFQKTIKLLINK